MSETNTIETENSLHASFEGLMAFRPLQANDLLLADDKIRDFVQQEIVGGKINASVNGVTPGMRQHIFQPAREYLQRWEKVKGSFEAQIHPFRQDIESLEKMGGEIDRLQKHKENQVAQIQLRAEADRKFQRARDYAFETDARYRKLKSNEGGREAITSAYGFYYWPALMLIGVTEWLINYDTFFSFLGVPAIAAGATIIIGILLAFAAHGHGTILKQWSSRFGQDRSVAERRSEWRFLFLSTFSLLIVLAAAGGARYESAIKVVVHLSQSGSGLNVLGTDASFESNPMRDVLLSLLANVAAWAVGVFLAYLTHDKNLDYMQSAKRANDAEKAFQAIHKKYIEDDLKTEEAKVKKGIDEIDASARDRRTGVEAEYGMWKAAKERDADVKNALSGVLKHNLELYKNAVASNEGISIYIDGKEVSAAAYHQVKINYNDDFHVLTGQV